MQQGYFVNLTQSIIDRDSDRSFGPANHAIAAGIDPLDAIAYGFVKGINQVRKAFTCGPASSQNCLWEVKP